MLGKLKVLLQVAFRNLFSSVINWVIGGLILVGTMLIVVGGALLDSMDAAMSRSIIGSVAGHIQVYSSASKDELSLFGNFGAESDLSPVNNFAQVKKTLESVPNVKTVVPMGINGAMITSGNIVDLTLASMRDLLRKRRESPTESAEQKEQWESYKAHVRQIVTVLQTDMKRSQDITREKAVDQEARQVVEKASSAAFWAGFDKDPEAGLEFLENQLAPQVADGDLLYLRYVGTDFSTFQQSFDRMQIVDGTAVPPGKRGFLFAKFFYEDQLKLKTARRLDLIKEALGNNARKSIAGDPVLQRYVKENQLQTREIQLQLDPVKTQKAVLSLRKALGVQDGDLGTLLPRFFATTDENFAERYRVFYAELAPLLELYRLRIGDILTIKAFTRSGYVQSVNVKVYGTFNFQGLEKSALSGSLSLMDLVSFRELYGYLTADKLEELAKLKAQSGLTPLDRDKAEDELFGAGHKAVVAEATPGVIDEADRFKGNARALHNEDLIKRVYSRDELENGVVLNAAVILKDPTLIDETIADIKQAAARNKLALTPVSWQKASGMLGQFVNLAKLGLYVAVFIIFVVTLVIINNAMMMAAMQRVREIGTLRAIGAQRSFVLSMILTEILALGLVFGTAGALLGTVIMKALGKVGIAASNDAMYFFFSGPRLFPHLGVSNLVAALVVILLVSSLSTLYPAILATRVSPVRAMQTDE